LLELRVVSVSLIAILTLCISGGLEWSLFSGTSISSCGNALLRRRQRNRGGNLCPTGQCTAGRPDVRPRAQAFLDPPDAPGPRRLHVRLTRVGQRQTTALLAERFKGRMRSAPREGEPDRIECMAQRKAGCGMCSSAR
jgi:hypothetical protein